jgi:hypothetical protein
MCKYTDHLFGTRCDMNVSIEVVYVIAYWERFNVMMLRLKRLMLPVRRVGSAFRLRMARL